MRQYTVNQESNDKYGPLLKDFYDRVDWLRSMITDPAGLRYFQEKNQERRLKEYQEQLVRTAAFLEFAGNPQDLFSSIHIAGTSGKGSVTTMIGAILNQCGINNGVHISPYLQVCNEKLVVNDDVIAPSVFIQLVDGFKKIHQAFIEEESSPPLRYGEAWVALTFLWFAQKHVDWAVVETGMGGRFDPTNVLPSKLAVITNIDLEHVPQLGTSLADIAYHKAGIIKYGHPVITSEQNSEVMDVIRKEADRKNAPLYCLGHDFNFNIYRVNHYGLDVDIETPFGCYDRVHIPQVGKFQAVNASLALMSVNLISREYDILISQEQIQTALEDWSFPGRMEVIQHNPLIIMDGAHNPQKIRALADSIQTIYPGKPITLIVGMLATKDVDLSMDAILPLVCRVLITQPKVLGKPAMPVNEFADIIHRINPAIEVITCDDIHKSIDLALAITEPDDLILITGSLYLVGEARNYWIPADTLLMDAERILHESKAIPSKDKKRP